MAYDGYIAFGGNELVNSERARGYARTLDCPMHWFIDEACQGLPYAVGDTIYDAADLRLSPWYDSTQDDISTRFYGVYGLSIAGDEDSTREVERAESLTDGGQIGRMRNASRDIRVQALLVGRGQDAVNYGMSWLNQRLDPDACGQVSVDCGVADVAFFSTCPPERPLTRQYTDWAAGRKNIAADPGANTPTLWATVGGTRSQVSSWIGAKSPQAIRHTRSATGAARLDVRIPAADYATATQYAVRVMFQASTDIPNVTPFLRPTNSSTTGQATASSITIPAGESEWIFVFTTTATAAGTPAFGITWSSGAVGDWVSMTDVLVEAGSAPGEFFTGYSSAGELEQYYWDGTPYQSASIQQVRTAFTAPEPDKEFNDRIDLTRRFMRRGAAISGAFKVREMESSGFWAYEVTFVLSGGPAIFGVTRA